MTPNSMTPLLGPEFDSFLFASVAEDKNGLKLSVLSALARLNVDPWREAAQLARLPKDAATLRLASLIEGQTNENVKALDAGPIAARLIDLLPLPRVTSRNTPGEPIRAWGRFLNSPLRQYMFVLMMAVLLGLQLVMAVHQRPTQPENPREQMNSASQPPVGAQGLGKPDVH